MSAVVPLGAEPAILVEDLGLRYGRVRALEGVSLRIPTGAVCALLGRNGAGKTSLVRALLGFAPAAGRVRVLGLDAVARRLLFEELVGDLCERGTTVLLGCSVRGARDLASGALPDPVRRSVLLRLALEARVHAAPFVTRRSDG